MQNFIFLVLKLDVQLLYVKLDKKTQKENKKAHKIVSW